jgi:hypothetical protein
MNRPCMKNDTIIPKQFPPHQPTRRATWCKKVIEKIKSPANPSRSSRGIKKGRRERNEKENKNTMEAVIYLTRIS